METKSLILKPLDSLWWGSNEAEKIYLIGLILSIRKIIEVRHGVLYSVATLPLLQVSSLCLTSNPDYQTMKHRVESTVPEVKCINKKRIYYASSVGK